MAFAAPLLVCWVERHPAEAWKHDLHPSVRGEGADKVAFRAIGSRRVGFNVSADIPAGDARCAKNAEHDVREVLADAFPFFPNTR